MAAATAPISSRFSSPVRRPSASGATSLASVVIDSNGRRPRRAANHAPIEVSTTPTTPASSVACSSPSIDSITGCSGAAAMAYSPLSIGTTLTLKLPDGRSIVPPRSCPAKRPDAAGPVREGSRLGGGGDHQLVVVQRQQVARRDRVAGVHEPLPRVVLSLPCSAPSAQPQLAGVRP